MRDRIDRNFAAAVDFIAPDRGEALVREWLPLQQPDLSMTEYRMMAMMADAVLLSTNLLVSQPSASGSTGCW
ncbi:MAG: hypothetical protein PHI71_00065 [Acidiphilium sp.]|nr:hypothetical protein [Acidiphilium sp.]